jgi:RNA polymerase sporulation-specific sigma factor
LEQLEQGSEPAKQLLIEHNLRLVVFIARRFENTGVNLEDLISIGTIGLIKAISTYRRDRNIKLATYASRCIENEILMYFRGSKKQNGEISFDEPIDTDSEGNVLTLMDIIAVDDTIIDDIDTKNKLIQLTKILKAMPEGRDKTIIILRYGLNGAPPMTQRDVAKIMNISRSYVSRIEKRILEEFKELL